MTKEEKLKEPGAALVSPKARMKIAATVMSKSEFKKGSNGKSKAKPKAES